MYKIFRVVVSLIVIYVPFSHTIRGLGLITLFLLKWMAVLTIYAVYVYVRSIFLFTSVHKYGSLKPFCILKGFNVWFWVKTIGLSFTTHLGITAAIILIFNTILSLICGDIFSCSPTVSGTKTNLNRANPCRLARGTDASNVIFI